MNVASSVEMHKEERRAHPRHDLETPAKISVEPQADHVDESTDKRSHDRFSVNYKINIEAGLHLGGQEVLRITMVGKTIDVSRGGMLIRVDKDVIPGARCSVHFLDSKGKIEPDKTSGRVR